MKGIIYCLIGLFAIGTVLGLAAGPNGPKQVISWIGTNPFGKLLLCLVVLGLVSYSLWRWYKSLADTENVGHDKKGLVRRIAWSISGVTYGFLAFYTAKLILAKPTSGDQKEDILIRLLNQSWGEVAIWFITLIMLCVAGYEFYRAISEKFMKDIGTRGWDSKRHNLYRTFGKVGHLSRGVVYGVIAFFLGRVALLSDANQFKGMGGSLSAIGENGVGAVILAIVGGGLLFYGLFMFVVARYRSV